MSEETQDNPGGLGVMQTDLAAGSTHIASDLNMIRRAVVEGWDVPAAKKPVVVVRMLAIIEKTSVTVMTKDGPESIEATADANSIKAASVLVSMTGEKQRDIHAADKNNRLDTGKLTENHGFMPAIVEQPVPVKPRD